MTVSNNSQPSLAQDTQVRDPLLNVFSFLTPQDVVQSGKTCKVWHAVSKEKKLWEIQAKKNGIEIVGVKDPKRAVLQNIKEKRKLEKRLKNGALSLLHTLEGHNAGISSLALVNGQLFSADSQGTIKVWQEEEGKWKEKLSFKAHAKWVSEMNIENGKLMTRSETELKLWDWKEEKMGRK